MEVEMTRTAMLSSLALAVGLCVGTVSPQDAAPKASADVAAKPITVRQVKAMSQADLKWETDPESKVAMAVVSGNPKTGAYEAFLKFPAGMELPLHWHTFSNTGVGVSGNLVIEAQGQAAVEMGPGGWGFVPGRLKHTTKCRAGADCVIYARQPGKNDMNFVRPTARK
jgi:hypothetical protein